MQEVVQPDRGLAAMLTLDPQQLSVEMVCTHLLCPGVPGFMHKTLIELIN